LIGDWLIWDLRNYYVHLPDTKFNHAVKNLIELIGRIISGIDGEGISVFSET
jgi:hypothetical protein